MQLVYQVCYTRYKVLFYLSQIRPSLNHYRVPKYFDQDFLKFLFCFLHFQLWKMCSCGSRKLILSKDYQKSKAESFLLLKITYAKLCSQETIKCGIYDWTFFCSDIPGKNFWGQKKEIQKNCKGLENFDIYFRVRFYCNFQMIYGKTTGY